MPHVLALMTHVLAFKLHVLALMTHVLALMPRVLGLMPHVLALMPHMLALMTHVLALISQSTVDKSLNIQPVNIIFCIIEVLWMVFCSESGMRPILSLGMGINERAMLVILVLTQC